MRAYSCYSLALFTSLVLVIAAFADSSCPDAQVIADYTYCQSVARALIQNVGHSGTYQKVIGMDSNTGQITSGPFSFSGPLAPFDEDLSLHFRGPLNLKQFAVYVPGTTKKKRSNTKHYRMAHHAHVHARHNLQTKVVEIVDVDENVIVQTTLDGNATTLTKFFTTSEFLSKLDRSQGSTTIQSSVTVSGDSPLFNPSTTFATITAPLGGYGLRSSQEPTTQSSTSVIAETSASAAETPLSYDSQVTATQTSASVQQSGGDWQRSAFYDSDNKISDGITFLNNKGGQGSGVFDLKFGLSLSYADCTAETAAQSSTIFDGFLNNTVELAIFSDTPCSEESCGFWRPGAPAYRKYISMSRCFSYLTERSGIWRYIKALSSRV
jgi:hypothetical protein